MFSKVIMSGVGPKPNAVRAGQSWSYNLGHVSGMNVPLFTITSIDSNGECLWSTPSRGCPVKYLLTEDYCRFVSEPKPAGVEVGQIWTIFDLCLQANYQYHVNSVSVAGWVVMSRNDGSIVTDTEGAMLKDNIWSFYSGPDGSSPVIVSPQGVALAAINDHTCPGCGNTRCSKSERTCWRCGGKL